MLFCSASEESILIVLLFQVIIFQSDFYFYSRLVELSGDVEKNPGPNSKPDQSFSICYWNLNSITAYNFSKILSLSAYNCIYHFEIICLSETFLNSDISSDNEYLDIPGYRLIRSDHPSPSNDKRGGVCFTLNPLTNTDIKLHECINLKIRIDDKLCNLIYLYRSPSQTWKNLRRLLKILS